MFYNVYFGNMMRPESAELPEEIIRIKLEVTSLYLFPLAQGYLLFDTGYAKEYGKFLRLLAKKNINVADINYIVLSHHHDDHSGFLNQLAALNPALKIILHENALPLLARGKNSTDNGGGIVNPLMYFLFRAKKIITPAWDFTFPPFTARPQDIIIRDSSLDPARGETGLPAEVMHTPGHSTDSISMIYKDRYLFCGDLASNFLNFAGAGNLTIFNEDIDRVYTTWEKILSRGIQVIAPAHGRPFSAQQLKKNIYKNRQENCVKYPL